MAFICNECIAKRGWPEPSMFVARSFGPCELCKETKSCADI